MDLAALYLTAGLDDLELFFNSMLLRTSQQPTGRQMCSGTTRENSQLFSLNYKIGEDRFAVFCAEFLGEHMLEESLRSDVWRKAHPAALGAGYRSEKNKFT